MKHPGGRAPGGQRFVRWGAWALLGLLISGCATPSRVRRQLGTVGGLIATNSPMLVDEAEPDRDDDRLWINYTVILQNDDVVPVTMRLDAASVELGGRSRFVPCRVHERANQTTFPPGDRFRIDCRIEVDAEARRGLERRDLDARIVLPFSRTGREGWLEFVYPFRIEDAS